MTRIFPTLASLVLAAASASAVAGTEVKQKEGSLKFRSADGQFSTRIGGRIMADYAFIDDGRNLDGNGSEMRRARLFIKGSLFRNCHYKAQYDFAGNSVTTKDLYLAWKGLDHTTITLGNHKMPFGLEENTSSKYISFMERSAPNDVFAVGRQNGISFKTHGDNWTFAAAAHMKGIDNHNKGTDEGNGFGARLTWAPLAGKEQAVHLGAAVHVQQFADDFNGEYGTVRYRARPEIHTINTRPFDTRIAQADQATTLGLEAAAVLGPLSLQGEYFNRNVSSTVAGASDVNMNGYYLYASWFLTGEHRNYKAKKGSFGRVKPASIVGKGGAGAWELGLRYSSLDLNDGDTNPAITNPGESGNILTVGVNWYATAHIRFVANYTNTQLDQSADIHALQFRAQIDF